VQPFSVFSSNIIFMKHLLVCLASFLALGTLHAQEPADYVNPFIGTTNFGTCNPGAVCPNGMMSVVPFNVMGSEDNKYDKDARWWSTPYDYTNSFFTGFAHVNLSGVGCPELGSLLLMPTTGKLDVDYRNYGSKYEKENATPGYYTISLTKYNILAEATATPRTGLSRFTFPKGESNILLNLGEGLTNETGAFMRRVSDCEVEGMKVLGTFCYNPQAVFPIYFVMRINKAPKATGYWKKQRPMQGVEAEWDKDQGKYKLYTQYNKDIAGDDIGAWFSFDTEEGEQIEVAMGVSFVSIENARENLDKEQSGRHFAAIHQEARQRWNDDLGRIKVEGGTKDQKTVFYTGLYHALIHPNILQDINGEYPQMEGDKILTTKGNRYTVFSLWDTYRNLHQLMTLVYPERQMDMINTIDFLREQNSVAVEWQECIFALIKFFEVECISDSDSWSMITITPCNPVTVFNPGNTRIVFIFRFDHISITSLELNRFMVYFPIYTILAESCKNVHLYSFVVATENSCKSVFIRNNCAVEYTV
jgi:predicted alpha-1,2-mannosidase